MYQENGWGVHRNVRHRRLPRGRACSPERRWAWWKPRLTQINSVDARPAACVARNLHLVVWTLSMGKQTKITNSKNQRVWHSSRNGYGVSYQKRSLSLSSGSYWWWKRSGAVWPSRRRTRSRQDWWGGGKTVNVVERGEKKMQGKCELTWLRRLRPTVPDEPNDRQPARFESLITNLKKENNKNIGLGVHTKSDSGKRSHFRLHRISPACRAREMSTDMAVTCRLPLVSDRAAKVTPHKDGQTPESTSSSKGHTNREIWIWIFFRIVNLS